MRGPSKVAFFSPLPPAETGTADYAAKLIPNLRNLVELHVFEKEPHGFNPKAYDAVIYQLANNPFHAGIYQTALRHPGIAVLHEPNLHDLIRGLTVNSPEAYLREVTWEIFGEERSAMQAAGYAPTGAQSRNFSMLRRVLDSSRACIVHSFYAAGMVRMKGFRGRIEMIPHGIDMTSVDGAIWRNQLGLRPGQPLIGIFGYLRPDKRVAEGLRAFRMLIDSTPDARMLIVGKPHSEVPVESLIEELGLRNRVFVLGLVPDAQLDGYIAACDIVLNLRWPTFGETSGVTSRAFGLGKTVVVSDAGASREYPEDTCVRIPCDIYLESVLRDTLAWLLASPQVRAGIGTAAAKWAEQNCTWPIVARRYAEFARVYSKPSAPTAAPAEMPAGEIGRYLWRWVEPSTDRAQYLQLHETRLCRTLQLIPAGTPDDCILEMGCYLHITPALSRLLGYGEVRGCYLGAAGTDLKMITARDGETFGCNVDLFDCERDIFPYANGTFAVVLCCELLEHLRRDPMRMVSEIYRVLREGGVLILTTPNIVSLRALNAIIHGNHPGFYSQYPDPHGDPATNSRHEREYTPAEISKLLEASGFTVEHLETGCYGVAPTAGTELAVRVLSSLGLSTGLRDDCIFAAARKEALPRDPFPSWLYETSSSLETSRDATPQEGEA
jgi:glycosyltransferase involved in cell wall biosynthesis